MDCHVQVEYMRTVGVWFSPLPLSRLVVRHEQD